MVNQPLVVALTCADDLVQRPLAGADRRVGGGVRRAAGYPQLPGRDDRRTPVENEGETEAAVRRVG